MHIKLIEELRMTASAELYQLSCAIEQLLADLRRIVQAHRVPRELHRPEPAAPRRPDRAHQSPHGHARMRRPDLAHRVRPASPTHWRLTAAAVNDGLHRGDYVQRTFVQHGMGFLRGVAVWWVAGRPVGVQAADQRPNAVVDAGRRRGWGSMASVVSIRPEFLLVLNGRAGGGREQRGLAIQPALVDVVSAPTEF